MHNTCGFLVFPQAVLKVLARLKYSELLYKTEDEFLIPAEECITFESVSSTNQCYMIYRIRKTDT